MEGRVEVESELGNGSVFRVQLPLDLAQAEDLQAPEDEAPLDVSGLRILVVDDIDVNRDLLELQLGTFGCSAIKVGGGDEALATMEEHQFDLVLLDCQMPDMDGYEVARQVRARWPRREVRIVAVTAHAQPDERSKCISSGMDDYVPKPLAINVLARVLRDSLPKSMEPGPERTTSPRGLQA